MARETGSWPEAPEHVWSMNPRDSRDNRGSKRVVVIWP
jgi:hypothetical protein